jgi:hypothetical protein
MKKAATKAPAPQEGTRIDGCSFIFFTRDSTLITLTGAVPIQR